MNYKIMRIYFKNKKPTQIIKRGLTLEQAKKHCSDPKTRKEGVWFDAFTKDYDRSYYKKEKKDK